MTTRQRADLDVDASAKRRQRCHVTSGRTRLVGEQLTAAAATAAAAAAVGCVAIGDAAATRSYVERALAAARTLRRIAQRDDDDDDDDDGGTSSRHSSAGRLPQSSPT